MLRAGGSPGPAPDFRVRVARTVRTHPCLACGACCASFRVSFYWTEGADATPGGVPVEATEPLPPHRRVMRGTGSRPPRCVALVGDVGRSVSCAIHPARPSPCRDFEPSWELGRPNPDCDRARVRFGLAPLRPEDWGEPPAGPPDEPPREPPVPRAA